MKRPSRSHNQIKLLLYSYPDDKARLQQIEADAIHGRKGEPGQARRGSRYGDPTSRAALALASDAEVAELARRIGIVERALRRVLREHQPYISQRVLAIAWRVYFKKDMTLTGLAIRLNRTERTVRRWNKLLMRAVEREL